MKTLVVRPGALGDTILTLPLLNTIARQDPTGVLAYLGARAYLPLLPAHIKARPIDDVSSLWLFDESLENAAPSDFMFDIAYLILHSPGPAERNLIRSGTKAVKIVSPQGDHDKHIVAVLHQHAGLPQPPRVTALSHIAPMKKLSAVWLHPGSGGPRKCAPLSLFVSLSKLLHRHYKLPSVVTASEQDAFLTREPEWESLLELPGNRVLMNRPILEICGELGGAVLFVGNDSGIAHLAAGLGVKSLLFFCQTDPRRWAPWAPPDQVRALDCRRQPPNIEYIWDELCALMDISTTSGAPG